MIKDLVFAERPYVGEEEPTTFEDMSRFGNDGTVTGATWTRLPSGLWVLSFDDEDDDVNIGHDPSLNIRGPLTIMNWFKPDETNKQSVTILKGSYNDGFQLDCRTSITGAIVIKTAGGDLNVQYSSQTTNVGTWNHYCGTYDGVNLAGMHYYTNGVLTDGTSTGTGTGNIKDNISVDLTMMNVSGRNYDGDLALPKIIQRALSAQEIADIFEKERSFFGV